jgi:TIR domain/SIR2-like domain
MLFSVVCYSIARSIPALSLFIGKTNGCAESDKSHFTTERLHRKPTWRGRFRPRVLRSGCRRVHIDLLLLNPSAAKSLIHWAELSNTKVSTGAVIVATRTGITVAESNWTDEDWDNLVSDIQNNCVIPILGSELLVIDYDGQTVPLYRAVAEEVAKPLHLPKVPISQPRTLNQVVCEYIDREQKRNSSTTDRNRIYGPVSAALNTLHPPIPAALTKLAQILPLSLFVVTTPDSLMEQALNQIRFGGMCGAHTLAFTPSGPEDLPVSHQKLESPTVYHLFGKMPNLPNQFVVSDEDMVEFFFSLQQKASQLPLLFDALKANHLLFLGGSFSDWLARFFLRVAKQKTFSEMADYNLLAADRFANEPDLVLFLRTFSKPNRILSNDPIAFVDELHSRWTAKYPPPPPSTKPAYIPPAPQTPRNCVFISYASEDREAVKRLKAGLDAAGFTVWFDKEQLMVGMAWEREIHKNIRQSAAFIPVISNNTEKWLRDVFFRKEWGSAANMLEGSDPTWNFVLPVAIDPISPNDAHVPESFRTRNFEILPRGEPTPRFIQQLRRVVDENVSRPQRKHSSATPTT